MAQPLTEERASQYALQTVSAWLPGVAVAGAISGQDDDGQPTVDVTLTASRASGSGHAFYGVMTVWLRDDGSIYGEV